MTVLTSLPDVSDQAPVDAPEPGWGETFSAGWTSDAIRTDSRLYSLQVQKRLMDEIYDRLPEDAQARVTEFTNANTRDQDRVWQQIFDEAAEVRDPGLDEGWARLPSSREELEVQATSIRRAELEEAETVLGAGSGVAGFFGQAASAVADPYNIVLAPIGGGGGSILRIGVKEALLGGLAEAMVLPREALVSDELGIDRPNPWLRIGLGAGISGALATAVVGLPRALGYRAARREAEAASRPAAANDLDHRADIEGARQDLELGNSFRTEDPPNWDRIEAGIFAGESGGDFNALFGFSNRDGGPFANVRLTEMTVDEAIAFSRPDGPYAQWVKGKIGRVATPMGAFQIVGSTLRRAKRGLGLTGKEFMTPSLQRELGKYVYRTQGTGAWVGYAGPRTPGPLPTEFAPYRTSRGYTGAGQVMVGDQSRIDVSYEVVDASLLRQASGELQPRDRARAASDAWVADTAARLDPAQLMPAPTADRGAPIVGPDGMIESGNGRVRAIERAYERHPDRADAYRRQIEDAGYTIPEGVERPVLIARRTTELDPAARRQLVVDAQDSGVARMTATERSRIGSRALSADALALYRPDRKLSAAENRDFARAFAGAFPRSERNAFINEQGRISTDGIRQIQDALFARAWEAPDIIARAVEAEPGQLKSLIDALADAAPEVAALRADIEAGLVRADMDITPFILDAARIIIAARDAAGQGQAVADLLEEFLGEVDLLDGAVAPLTQALVRAMMPGGRQAPAKKIADFLKRYAEEARKAGRVGDVLGDAPGPLDVLKRMDPEAFGDLAETGTARIREPEPLEAEVFPDSAFADGAASPEAEAADALALEQLTPAEVAPIERLADMDPGEAAALDFDLKSAQAFSSVDEIMERAARNHDELTAEIGRAAGEAGAAQKVAPLKGRARVEEKIRDKYRGELNEIADVARGGVMVESPDMAEAFIAALAARYRVIDEGWQTTPVGYFDRKLVVVFDDGQLGEVQLWAPGMLEAKESAEVIGSFGMPETFTNAAGKVKPTAGGHALYEISRDLNQPAELRARADAAMSELYQEVREALPPDWRSVLGRQESSGIEAPNRSTTLEKSSSLTSGEPSSAYTSEATIGPQLLSERESSNIVPGSGSTAGMERSTRKNLMGDTSTPDIATNLGLDNTLTFDLPDGTTLSAREILDDLEADDTLAAVIEVCATGRAA